MGVGLPMHRPGVLQSAGYLLGAAPPKMLCVRLETLGYKVPAAPAPGRGCMALLKPHGYRDDFLALGFVLRSQRPRVVQPYVLVCYVNAGRTWGLPNLLRSVVEGRCVQAGLLHTGIRPARIEASVDSLCPPRDFIQRLVAGIYGRAGTVPRRRGVLGYVVCIE